MRDDAARAAAEAHLMEYMRTCEDEPVCPGCVLTAMTTFAAQAAQREAEAIAAYVEGHADHRQTGNVIYRPSYEALAASIRARHPAAGRGEG